MAVRLFVAVEVPSDVRSAVADAVAPAREAAPRLRWVDPAKYHLTLVFLGAVDESLLGAVGDAVAAGCAGVEQFSLALDGRVGTFGRGVVWAGLAESAALVSVGGSVGRALGSVVEVADADRA